jgi:putative heme iron utilization protein
VAGFGRAPELPPEALLTDLRGTEALLAAEPDALAHMNTDHAEAIARYATRKGAAPGPWRLVGLDPEGMDLLNGERALRVPFPTRVTDPAMLRATLVAMER